MLDQKSRADELSQRTAGNPRRAEDEARYQRGQRGRQYPRLLPRSIIDMYQPRKTVRPPALGGIMGIGMGYAVGAGPSTSGLPVVAIEGDSAFSDSVAWNLKTICRYQLPVVTNRFQQQRRLPWKPM